MKNFDEKIRDKLFDAEMPVSDDLWNYIDSQISNKKERPKYWLFFFVSLILIPGFYLGYQVAFNKDLTEQIVSNDTDDAQTQLQSDFLEHKNTTDKAIARLEEVRQINSIKPNSISRNKSKKQSFSFQIITNKNALNAATSNGQSFIKNKHLNSLASLDQIHNKQAIQSQFDGNNVLKRDLAGTPQCPSFNGKDNKFYAFANAAANYPFQLLSSRGNENDLYIQTRNNTESSFLSYAFDAGLGFQLNDNLFLQAGIMYNQVNMKFHLIEEGQSRNSTITVIDTIRDSNGAIVDIETNTFINQEVGTEETVSLNKFKQLDIPLSIGYRLPLTRRFNLMISGGVVFNLKTQSSGNILDPKGEPIDFGKDITDGPFYSTKVGLSYTSSVKLETEIYPDLFLNAGLDLRYYAGNFNSTSNPINQKYLSVGLGTGMRYKF